MTSKKNRSSLEIVEEFLRKARRKISSRDDDDVEGDLSGNLGWGGDNIDDESDWSPESDLSERSIDDLDSEGEEADDNDSDEDNDDLLDTEDPEDEMANEFLRQKLGLKGRSEGKKKKVDSELKPAPEKKVVAAAPMVRRRQQPDMPSTQQVTPPAPPATAAASPVSRHIQQMQATPQFSATDHSNNELQPTPEELHELREFTRPYVNRYQELQRLQADPRVNPVRHHDGRVREAAFSAYQDWNKALSEFESSPEYQSAGKAKRRRLLQEFQDKFHQANPGFLDRAAAQHEEARQIANHGYEAHARDQDAILENVLRGGHQAGSYSLEEGLQHAGIGSSGEDEGPRGNISADRAAQFAAANREFLEQEASRPHRRRITRPGRIINGEVIDFDNEQRRDPFEVLGDNPVAKNAALRRKIDDFTARYYPLIHSTARHVVRKLGLSDHANRGQIDLQDLEEPGINALYEAINDYDHNHPSKSSFPNFARKRIAGHMLGALRRQMGNAIPERLLVGAKKFQEQRAANMAGTVTHIDKLGNVTHSNPGNLSTSTPTSAPVETMTPPATPTVSTPPKPVQPKMPAVRRSSQEIAAEHSPEVQDRLKRVVAAKGPMVRRGTGGTQQTQPKKHNVYHVSMEDEEE